MVSVKGAIVATAIVGALGLGMQAARANSVYIDLASHSGTTWTYTVSFANDVAASPSLFKAGAGAFLDNVQDVASATFAPAVTFDPISADWTFAYNTDVTFTTSGTQVTAFTYGPSNSGGTDIALTYDGLGSTTTGQVIGTIIVTTNTQTNVGLLSQYGADYNNNHPTSGLFYNTHAADGPASVPVPAAAWAGMSLLGGMGALGALRRKARA